MGVDSGLPDFRGNEGFWRAYPPFARLGISFVEMASPHWFEEDPRLAWGFYGHRLALYRRTEPHAGFGILRRWAGWKEAGAFVFTSNVDGHFQRAGWSGDRLLECHGSIHHLQCSGPCSSRIWSADGIEVEVDESTFRAVGPLPRCPDCERVARPNILLFGDGGWVAERTERQEQAFATWLARVRERELVVIEMGAGTAVPTVRWQGEEALRHAGASLVRINPREENGPSGTISIRAGALETLQAIDALFEGSRSQGVAPEEAGD